MSKYMFIADTHIKGVNPINRKGDFYQDIMFKIDEIIEKAKINEVKAIIHCGDVYDSANVSLLMIDDFIDKIEKAKIKMYINPGNHDLIAHYWNNSKSSALAHIFRRSDYIIKLDKLFDKDNNVLIQGFPYYHNCESDIKEKGIYADIDKRFKGYKIAVTHAMIVKKLFPFEIMQILDKDIKTNFDTIICSHYHLAEGINEMDGVRFVRLPVLGRTSIRETRIKPSVAIFDTETKKIEIIPLTSAKKGSEVFDLEKVEKSKSYADEVDKFINSLTAEKMEQLDLLGIIEKLAKDNNLDETIKKCVISRIGENNDQL